MRFGTGWPPSRRCNDQTEIYWRFTSPCNENRTSYEDIVFLRFLKCRYLQMWYLKFSNKKTICDIIVGCGALWVSAPIVCWFWVRNCTNLSDLLWHGLPSAQRKLIGLRTWYLQERWIQRSDAAQFFLFAWIDQFQSLQYPLSPTVT